VEKLEKARGVGAAGVNTGTGGSDSSRGLSSTVAVGPLLRPEQLRYKSVHQQRGLLFEAQLAVRVLEEQSEKDRRTKERKERRAIADREAQQQRELLRRQREDQARQRRIERDARLRQSMEATYAQREQEARERRENLAESRAEARRQQQAAYHARQRHAQKWAGELQAARTSRYEAKQNMLAEIGQTQAEVLRSEQTFMQMLKKFDEDQKRENARRRAMEEDIAREKALCDEMERKLHWLERSAAMQSSMDLNEAQ
jgi:hypothetical protein